MGLTGKKHFFFPVAVKKHMQKYNSHFFSLCLPPNTEKAQKSQKTDQISFLKYSLMGL